MTRPPLLPSRTATPVRAGSTNIEMVRTPKVRGCVGEIAGVGTTDYRVVCAPPYPCPVS